MPKDMEPFVIDCGYGGKLSFYTWSYGGNKGAEVQAIYSASFEESTMRPSCLSDIGIPEEGIRTKVTIAQRMGGMDPAQLRALAKWANAAARNVEALIRQGLRDYP